MSTKVLSSPPKKPRILMRSSSRSSSKENRAIFETPKSSNLFCKPPQHSAMVLKHNTQFANIFLSPQSDFIQTQPFLSNNSDQQSIKPIKIFQECDTKPIKNVKNEITSQFEDLLPTQNSIHETFSKPFDLIPIEEIKKEIENKANNLNYSSLRNSSVNFAKKPNNADYLYQSRDSSSSIKNKLELEELEQKSNKKIENLLESIKKETKKHQKSISEITFVKKDNCNDISNYQTNKGQKEEVVQPHYSQSRKETRVENHSNRTLIKQELLTKKEIINQERNNYQKEHIKHVFINKISMKHEEEKQFMKENNQNIETFKPEKINKSQNQNQNQLRNSHIQNKINIIPSQINNKILEKQMRKSALCIKNYIIPNQERKIEEKNEIVLPNFNSNCTNIVNDKEILNSEYNSKKEINYDYTETIKSNLTKGVKTGQTVNEEPKNLILKKFNPFVKNENNIIKPENPTPQIQNKRSASSSTTQNRNIESLVEECLNKTKTVLSFIENTSNTVKTNQIIPNYNYNSISNKANIGINNTNTNNKSNYNSNNHQNNNSIPSFISKEIESTKAPIHSKIDQMFFNALNRSESLINKHNVLKNGPINAKHPTIKANLNYNGDYLNNQKHGFGLLANDLGQKIYIGDWILDKYHGQGVLYNIKLDLNCKIEIDSKKINLDLNTWKLYEGEFQNGEFYGMGSLSFATGERFNGKFINGKIEGEGTFYKADGDIIMGVWENNNLKKIF